MGASHNLLERSRILIVAMMVASAMIVPINPKERDRTSPVDTKDLVSQDLVERSASSGMYAWLNGLRFLPALDRNLKEDTS